MLLFFKKQNNHWSTILDYIDNKGKYIIIPCKKFRKD